MKKVVNTLKKITNKINKKQVINTLAFAACVIALNTNSAYAAGLDTSKLSAFDEVINFILALVTKLGIGVGVWGGIDIALSFKSDSPEQKDKGMKLLIAGIALICVGASASYFQGL